MLALTVAAAFLVAAPSTVPVAPPPGDGLSLGGLTSRARTVARTVTSVLPGAGLPALPRVPLPIPPLPPVPILPLPPSEPAAEARPRRRRRRRRGGGWVPEDVFFIYVPGHGGDPNGFADLARRMGLRADQVLVFDYRMAGPWDDRIAASKEVPVGEAATALQAVVRREASRHSRIYLVGHSKGGAVVAEAVADWDAEASSPAGVVGAALLDPPIASGWLGRLQRIGRLVGDVPDNGGFDPRRCDPTGCRDVRADLGRRSGIEVVVIRDPRALVTNFSDRPGGLRVYDVRARLGRRRLRRRGPARLWEAHHSMLHDDVTARCVAAEASRPGSCRWPDGGAPRRRVTGRGRPVGVLVE